MRVEKSDRNVIKDYNPLKRPGQKPHSDVEWAALIKR